MNTLGFRRCCLSIALTVYGLMVSLGWPSASLAQVLFAPGPQAEERVETIRLTLSPAAEPKPALRFRFLVPAVDQIRGNAATLVYKSMVFEAPDYVREIEQLSDDVDAWLGMPLGDLPRDEILGKVHWLSEKSAWQPLCEAARCDQCDWGDPVREEGAETLLPQTQKMRGLARGLALKARLEMAQGQYDDSIETLRVGYALTRNLGRAPCLVQCLVGLAIQGILDQQTRALMECDDSPNLYWALTDLAAQTVNLREALSYEMKMWEFSIHELEDLERVPLTNEQAASLADKVWSLVGKMRIGNVGKPAKQPAEILLWATELYPQAKAYLLKNGYTAAKLDEYPPLQIVLIYRWKQYRDLCDDYVKWGLLPDAEVRAGMAVAQDTANKQRKDGIGGPFSERGAPFYESLQGFHTVLSGRLKYERQINILRAIEALRMHAAEYGRFPDKLEDISIVPVPHDPYTGKPFDYSGSGGIARLSTPHDETWTPRTGAVLYELELRRPAAKNAAGK